MNIIDLVKKIRRFQFGGVAVESVPGISTYQPIQLSPREQKFTPDYSKLLVAAPKAPEAPSMDKEALKGLVGKGHTNDVNAIVGRAEQAEALLKQKMSFDPYYLKTAEGKALLQQMTLSQTDINKMLQYKENTNKAEDLMMKNEGGSSFATTSDGNFLVRGEKGIQVVRPQDYFSNKQNYQLLTNAQIREMRDRDPNMTLSDISPYITNTVGQSKVDDYMKNQFINLGHSSNEGERELIGNLQRFGSKEELLGFIKSSGSNKNNAMQVKSALDAMLKGMPSYIKNTLYSQAAQQANTAEQAQENMYSFLWNYANKMRVNETKSSQTLQYNEGMNKAHGIGADKTKLVDNGDFFMKWMGDKGLAPIQDVEIGNGQFKIKLGGSYYNTTEWTKGDKPALITSDKSLIQGIRSQLKDKTLRTADGKPIPEDLVQNMIMAGDKKAVIIHTYPTDDNRNPLPLEVVQRMEKENPGKLQQIINSGRVTSVTLFEAAMRVPRSPMDFGKSDRQEQLPGFKYYDMDDEDKGKQLRAEIDLARKSSNIGVNAEGDYTSPFTGGYITADDDVAEGVVMMVTPKPTYNINGMRFNHPDGIREAQAQEISEQWNRSSSTRTDEAVYNTAYSGQGAGTRPAPNLSNVKNFLTN